MDKGEHWIKFLWKREKSPPNKCNICNHHQLPLATSPWRLNSLPTLHHHKLASFNCNSNKINKNDVPLFQDQLHYMSLLTSQRYHSYVSAWPHVQLYPPLESPPPPHGPLVPIGSSDWDSLNMDLQAGQPLWEVGQLPKSFQEFEGMTRLFQYDQTFGLFQIGIPLGYFLCVDFGQQWVATLN